MKTAKIMHRLGETKICCEDSCLDFWQLQEKLCGEIFISVELQFGSAVL